jgi:protein SCO1
MTRVWLYALALAAFVALGYGAFTLGQYLRPAPPPGGTELQTPVPVGHLALQSAEDEQVALADFAGRHLLVFFGFTRCPDVCPVTLARLARLYESLGEPEGLQVVMITVDPAFDTPEVVQRYASGFHPSFLGLSGSNPQVAEAAQTFYIGFQGAGEAIAHTDAVLLVDPESRFHRVYSQGNLDALQPDLGRLF